MLLGSSPSRTVVRAQLEHADFLQRRRIPQTQHGASSCPELCRQAATPMQCLSLQTDGAGYCIQHPGELGLLAPAVYGQPGNGVDNVDSCPCKRCLSLSAERCLAACIRCFLRTDPEHRLLIPINMVGHCIDFIVESMYKLSYMITKSI